MGKMKSPASLNFTWLSSGAEVIIIIIIKLIMALGHTHCRCPNSTMVQAPNTLDNGVVLKPHDRGQLNDGPSDYP